MKNFGIGILMVLILLTTAMAVEKVENPAECQHCGMDRTRFASSRMVVTYADGQSTGTCSLNCVVTDLKQKQGQEIKAIQVADFNSRKLLDARNASWVIGGSKQGVMTAVAKWAFNDRKEAEAFIKNNGGKLASFDEALAAAEKEAHGRPDSKTRPHKMK
jgi:nitrous oxide reductase accessory protein NosL